MYRALVSFLFLLFVPSLGLAEEELSRIDAIKEARADIRAKSAEDAESSATAQSQSEEDRSAVVRMGQGLALVLGVFCLFTFVLKKFTGSDPKSQKGIMLLKERLSLTQKASLHLVELRGQEILVAVNGENIQLQQLGKQASKEARFEGLLSDEINQETVVSECEREFKLSA